MMVQELREGNSYFFLGIGERQVVREVINADLGKKRESFIEGKERVVLEAG